MWAVSAKKRKEEKQREEMLKKKIELNAIGIVESVISLFATTE